MKYPMTIAGLKRELPLCKVGENFYIAAFIMFGDPEITVACARELLKKLENGAPVKTVRVAADDQISMTNLENDSLRKRLEQLSVETMTPIEAMNALFELKKMI